MRGSSIGGADHDLFHVPAAGAASCRRSNLGPVIGCFGARFVDRGSPPRQKAARRWPTLAFAVADLWGEWPADDATIDVVLSIFAPKNFGEMARVLRPGGWFALAYPGPEHLIELRDRFNLLRQNEESSGRYAEMTAHFIGPPSVARLHRHAVLDPALVRAAILMGPNARHVDPAILDVGTAPVGVTLDINLLFAARTGTS